MKTRKKQRAAAPASETGPSLTFHVPRNGSVNPEGGIDSSAADKSREPDLNLSSLAPTGGVAVRRLTRSQTITARRDETTRYIVASNSKTPALKI